MLFQALLQETVVIVDDYFAYILVICFLAVCFWMQFSPTYLVKKSCFVRKRKCVFIRKEFMYIREGFFRSRISFLVRQK